jgi:hypothetical protein
MPRQSARIKGKKRVDYAAMDSGSGSTSLFPEGPPKDEIERIFWALNLEAFPSSPYAHVDNILVHVLFATKHRPQSYRALHPETAGDNTLAGLTNEDALAISKIITSNLNTNLTQAADRLLELKEQCKVTALEIWCRFHWLWPASDSEKSLSIINQYVSKFHSLCKWFFDGVLQPSAALYFTPLSPQLSKAEQGDFCRPNQCRPDMHKGHPGMHVYFNGKWVHVFRQR